MKYVKNPIFPGKRGDKRIVWGIQWSHGDVETWDDPTVAKELYESLSGNDRRRAKLVTVTTEYMSS